MRKTSVRFMALATVASLLLAAGCTGDNGSDNGGNDGDTVDQVVYLTGFASFGREAYAWVALDKGYFAEVNIDVTIEPGGGTAPNIGLVTSGQAHFAAGDLTGALIQYGTGASQDFTVVAAMIQRTLAGIMTLADEGITAPRDLEGRTLGDAAGSVVEMLFPTYASLAGVDDSKVEFVNFPPPDLPGNLATGVVDGIGQFVVGKPTIEAVAGEASAFLPYSDYLPELYANALYLSKELAEQNPDLVRRFTGALLRGLEYTIDHPQEAGEILAKYVPEQNPAVAAAEIELLAPYVRPDDPGVPIGAIESQRIARAIAILQGAGAIPAGLTPEDVISFDLVPQG